MAGERLHRFDPVLSLMLHQHKDQVPEVKCHCPSDAADSVFIQMLDTIHDFLVRKTDFYLRSVVPENVCEPCFSLCIHCRLSLSNVGAPQ